MPNHDTFLDSLHAELKLTRTFFNNDLIAYVGQGTAQVGESLLGSEKIFQKMSDLIKNAQEEIFLMASKIDKGSDGELDLFNALKSLSDSLQVRQVQPIKKIKVRILINRKGRLVEKFHTANSDNIFRDLDPVKFPNLDIQYVEHTHAAFGMYHAKFLVVDQIAMVNSGDIKNVHNYKMAKDDWCELSTVLQGKAVKHLKYVFTQAWNSPSVNGLRQNKIDLPYLESMEVEQKLAGQTNTLVLYKKANGNYFNRAHDSPYVIAVKRAIQEAQRVVNISTPNLNISSLIEVLADAVQRGVTVNIVMPKNMNDKAESNYGMGGTNREAIILLYAELQKRNCENYEKVNVRWAVDGAGNIIGHQAPRTPHVKFVSADSIIITGSSPLDVQAQYFSQECDVVMEGASIASQYNEQVFNPLFEKAIDIFKDPENKIKLPAQKLLEEAINMIDDGVQKFAAAKAQILAELKAEQAGNKLNELQILDEALGKPLADLKFEKPMGLYELQANAKKLNLEPKKLKTAQVTELMSRCETICKISKEKLKPFAVNLEPESKWDWLFQLLEAIANWFKKKFSALGEVENNPHPDSIEHKQQNDLEQQLSVKKARHF